MIDYHIHPDYSIDAEMFSVDEYCRKALEIGLKYICFTTHCEFDPIRKELDWYVRCGSGIAPMHPTAWLDQYFNDINRCAKEYNSAGLDVKAGLEAGYDLGLEESIEKVLVSYPFDFVIGSVHCLDHVAISSKKESPGYYSGKSLSQVAADYFLTLREAVKTGLFDVIGHLDIYRRHGTSFLGEQVMQIHDNFIDDILSEMKKNGTGLELNTSSLRHGQGSFYPGEDILKRAVQAGITIFTVGSDCHRISELGLGVMEAIGQGENLGIKFSIFDKRRPRNLMF